MATTDPNKVKPSRVETILMAMLGESVEIDEPKSRVEELLLQLKEAIEQGGGSGFTPTQEQLDAMNSGIDVTKVAQIDTNENNISTEQGKTIGMTAGGSDYITVGGIRVYVSATAPTGARTGDLWIGG
jgi:hypothetical protein